MFPYDGVSIESPFIKASSSTTGPSGGFGQAYLTPGSYYPSAHGGGGIGRTGYLGAYGKGTGRYSSAQSHPQTSSQYPAETVNGHYSPYSIGVQSGRVKAGTPYSRTRTYYADSGYGSGRRTETLAEHAARTSQYKRTLQEYRNQQTIEGALGAKKAQEIGRYMDKYQSGKITYESLLGVLRRYGMDGSSQAAAKGGKTRKGRKPGRFSKLGKTAKRGRR